MSQGTSEILDGQGLAPRLAYLLAFTVTFVVTWRIITLTGNPMNRHCMLTYLILWMGLGGSLMALWLRRLGLPPILAAFPVGAIGAGALFSYGLWRGLPDAALEIGVLLPLLVGMSLYGLFVMLSAVWPGRDRVRG